jgi:hypothetical protein
MESRVGGFARERENQEKRSEVGSNGTRISEMTFRFSAVRGFTRNGRRNGEDRLFERTVNILLRVTVMASVRGR